MGLTGWLGLGPTTCLRTTGRDGGGREEFSLRSRDGKEEEKKRKRIELTSLKIATFGPHRV
jgi:hypothetical protein